IAERPVKPHSRGRERVDLQRLYDFVAVRPARIRRVIIGTDPEEVGAVGGGTAGNACLRSKENENCTDRKSESITHSQFPGLLSRPTQILNWFLARPALRIDSWRGVDPADPPFSVLLDHCRKS